MKEKVRYISADLLRGLVIIIMIEVHVFNAFLQPQLRQTFWFSILNFVNGLVAPSFLFVSGFAFEVSSGSKLDEMRKFGKAFWKKIGRIFQIIIIGYALHLPFYSLSKVIHKSTPQQIESFFAVDVLQCIGFGLLFLFLARLLIKSDKFYHIFILVSLIIVTFISPLLWKIDFNQYVHPLVGNYFNRLHGSLFPIFPWLNFLLAGALFARYFINAREQGEEENFIRKISIAGLITLLSGHIFYSGLFPKELTSIIPNPIFFLERLGYMLVLFYLCWMADQKLNFRPESVLDASRESLLIYWLHLIIIYGMFWDGKSLALIIGNNLSVIEVSAATIALITLMIIVAKLWGWMKFKYQSKISLVIKFAIVILIAVFIIY
ncbi:Acyltransferase domain protein [Ignavibacterium album JCM 16511]|uniref:Acyltransferase domain protein n=1 Tax=Ignavibacterium album (strain DSM 19864 / JCM 16511 / NBRC 101810 / Mat9-16) TaxID=945713 RepID=I0APE8_IGNAJ|nr:heparan-alpha-glucosaminide N-acetyltransferase domain-containing protein [Ignavibacterium album]AFH50855.1 Acyltransferase domain protein [Ignavibacterium album JCM 16511]